MAQLVSASGCYSNEESANWEVESSSLSSTGHQSNFGSCFVVYDFVAFFHCTSSSLHSCLNKAEVRS